MTYQLTVPAVLHDLQLVHTDLKPENILLVNNAYSVIEEQIQSAPGKVRFLNLPRVGCAHEYTHSEPWYGSGGYYTTAISG